jgi:multidrug efflux pump subunit AcrA (membrane-fusion protein)
MADPQWFANDVAVVAIAISLFALTCSALSVWYSRKQAKAAETQASEATLMRELNEKALLDQAEALRRQAALAENAADAAHRSAVAAEESARLIAQGQRAWVTIDAVQAAHAPVYLDRGQEITGHPEQIEFSAHTTIKNSGQTTANELRWTQELGIGALGPDDHPQYPAWDHANVVGSLGADAPTQLRNTIRVSPEQWEDVVRGRQTLYLWGRAEYRDVFRVVRETTWYLEYQRQTNEFSFADRFNSTT